ncbi:MAG: sulfite exporter TauE/SafE family protein [Oligoflexales bacterium]|nr:sulfite exporter TauE/SafE family protein [Oligoflexales bacterium]
MELLPAALITVIVTSFIQSMFGVGVLLFGTPILLFLGYPFVDILKILLPVSLSINAMQVGLNLKKIDLKLYKDVLIYSVPFVVVSLFFVSKLSINMSLPVGILMLVVAISNISERLEKRIASLIRYDKAYMAVMGIIHGLTNLGGSLLTAMIHLKNYPKEVKRTTIAACYATFAFSQIMTLMISSPRKMVLGLHDTLVYALSGVLVFILAEKIVYQKIDNEKHKNALALHIFASGILLVGKAFF